MEALAREPHRQFDPERMQAMEARRREQTPPEAILQELLPGPDAMLADIGCGPGFFALEAARLLPSGRVLAVDWQQSSLDAVVRRAKDAELANIETICADAVALPIADAAVDAVLMAHVFHDIPQRDAMLAEVRRVLRPGGRFLLLEWDKVETPTGPPLDIRIPPDALEQILAAGGFQVERVTLGPVPFYRVLATRP